MIYSEATEALARFAERTGVPVAETVAGKGSLRYDHPRRRSARSGRTAAWGPIAHARDADLVIGIGTRYGDFTTGSQTAFQNPEVRFVNINVAEFDAAKQGALMLVGDARATIEELEALLAGWQVAADYRAGVTKFQAAWDAEVGKRYGARMGNWSGKLS